MTNKQLTAADRGAIEALLRIDYNASQIAGQLGKDRSTVSREIKNRSTPNGYFAEIAQIDYETKRRRCRKREKLYQSWTQGYVIKRLKLGRSPEQIAGRMKLEGRPDRVCKETIYAFIYGNGYCVEEGLYQYLRRGKKRRTSWKGRKTHQSKIPNRVSIHKRPKEVEERIEYGHWEGDSVIYPYLKAINTLNELYTGRVKFTKLERKTALETAKAVEKAMEGERVLSFTFDNGVEFFEHEKITKATGAPVYFCDPYSSWQRGSNENANGLLRGYLPKRQSINDLSQEDLDDIAEELNNRPRKRLGYLSPNEYYYAKVQKGGNCCS